MVFLRSDLKQARSKLDLTQSQLAARSFLSQREVSRLETGAIDLNEWTSTHPGRWERLRSALNLDTIGIEICRRSDTAIVGDTPYIAFVSSGMAEAADLLPSHSFEVVFRG